MILGIPFCLLLSSIDLPACGGILKSPVDEIFSNLKEDIPKKLNFR